MIKDLADKLGLTSNGLKRSIESGKFPIEKVLPLCQTLGITVSEFFGESPQLTTTGNYAAHISGGNTQNSNEAILALKDQLKEKDKQISRLLSIIEKGKKA